MNTHTLTSPDTTLSPADLGFRNREDWLNKAAILLLEYAADRGYPKPIRPYISVGFPKGARGNTIGQCWGHARSADEHDHIFVHPRLDDGLQVLHVLLHELGHSLIGCEHGHRAPFSKWAAAMGLVKPWTATTPGPELTEALREMLDTLGEYPHAALDDSKKGAKKKSADRARRYECPGCGQKLMAHTDELHVRCEECDELYERKIKDGE